MARDIIAERNKKLGKIEPKPVEEWTTKDWEVAYNLLTDKYNNLRNRMRQALNTLSYAI